MSIDEDVFVIQPPGFGNGGPNKVWRLKKSVYGLKEAPRCWWAQLISFSHKLLLSTSLINEVLKGLGYEPTASDPAFM